MKKKTVTPEYLVDEFAQTVIGQTIAMEAKPKPNVRLGNRFSQKGSKIFKKLISLYGDNGREEIKTLFKHERKDVRGNAAVYLLRYCEEDALRVLYEIAESGKNFDAFCAQCAIENWKKGKWSLDVVVDSPENSSREAER